MAISESRMRPYLLNENLLSSFLELDLYGLPLHLFGRRYIRTLPVNLRADVPTAFATEAALGSRIRRQSHPCAGQK